MCGAIRYECTGEPRYIGYCHCRSCRHHSGAAVAGMLVFKPEQVSFVAGQLRIYSSSPGVERGFCRQCGTSLTWKGHGLMSLHIGTLDNPDEHTPTLHWRYEERSPWCDVGRDLPCVTMTFPGTSGKPE
ncbi:MAG: GFA family protein [Geminicoccales bacterium]